MASKDTAKAKMNQKRGREKIIRIKQHKKKKKTGLQWEIEPNPIRTDNLQESPILESDALPLRHGSSE
ncbi:hypothetical protein SODALDRAFT_58809 [Sodiomyces alkalinus F11]|uniref:Uncharacterized protein n=1 Tax=Sodiomyces alkalinus (strain CBS 110278 / VKM F-3762 / F11) TaxID=1314773 RepID=A0A3N2PNP4_SODAK|nr:hypothetical protein SODALDRAFT_58809 [Sodiomyces alkalinus F11]ROT36147.1 hypothetical protein SODALDRAFT_58809 [Sodiomyces alkalinus F11]